MSIRVHSWFKINDLVAAKGRSRLIRVNSWLERIYDGFCAAGFAGADACVHRGELLQVEFQCDHFMDGLAVANEINHLSGQIQIGHRIWRDDFLRRRRLDIRLERLIDLHDVREAVADDGAFGAINNWACGDFSRRIG